MDRPLQVRAGYNQGEQGMTLTQIRYLGQPAIKAGIGDTVIAKNSPVIPGENNPRSQMINLIISGYIFNRTGGDIDYDLLLVDPNGKEFPFLMSQLGFNFPLVNGDQHPILPFGLIVYSAFNAAGIPVFALLPDWSLILRVTSGNPTAGKGLIVWAWTHDMTRNLTPVIVPLTTTPVELGPAKGRAWQLCQAKTFQSATGSPIYLNFDSIPRTVTEEYFCLAGEEIQVNVRRNPPTGEIPVAPRTSEITGIEVGFQAEIGSEQKLKGLVLAYPDKIKVVAKENQKTAPLYMFITFAEFDLPKDMG